jgi:hypothetical protein
VPDYQNVKEQWFMYDSFAVSPWVETAPHPPSGWFSTFVALSNTDSVTFFDSRNKQIGLAYNNQDSRDQLSYAFVVQSISIGFFAPTCSSMLASNVIPSDTTWIGRNDEMSSFWNNELPQHTSLIFRVNQDERLKTVCSMVPPSYGPVGQCIGQGDLSDTTGPAPAIGGGNYTVSAGGMGRSHLKFRWEFPGGIGVPKRATMVAECRFTEWAREALRSLWGPGYFVMRDHDPDETPENPIAPKPSMFIMQCLLTGKREVQQRGEYHA